MTTRIAGIDNTVGLRAHATGRSASKASGSATFAAWLALIGLILPAWEINIYIAGAKFTAGRLGVVLLFIPAIAAICQRGRRFVTSDLFALLTAIWILVAAIATGGTSSLSSAGAESLEFIASYLAARAFFTAQGGLDSFVRVLRLLTIVAVTLAAADTATNRWISHDLAASMFGTFPLTPVFRGDMIRATSTFDHPILFGVFCGLVAAILLFWETNGVRRTLSAGICFVGCVLSQSSAALMCFALVLMAYGYERLMRQIPSRWTLFWSVAGILMAFLFVLSNNPMGWIISHLTLDPDTGYYRLLIWNAALDRISHSPFTGYAIELFNLQILDATVDSIWLVMALRFGIPTIAFLLLANVAACLPVKTSRTKDPTDSYTHRMRLAFTVVLLMFMFTGLTVHFWNYMWIFWGLCLGIRASLREQQQARPVSERQQRPQTLRRGRVHPSGTM